METFTTITPEHRAQLADFRKRLPALDARYDDHYLWRFLSAREYDLNEAEKMFKNHLEWRRRMGADTVLQDYHPPAVLQEYMALGWHGHDKQGHPVRYECVGRFDPRGLLRAVPKTDLLKFRTAYLMEDALRRCREASAAQGKLVDQITFICDFAEFGIKNVHRPFLQIVREIFKLLEENYPQVLRRVYIINPPGIFPYVFSLVSRLMHENTRRKFVVVRGACTAALLEEIDESQLLGQYGGKGPGPDSPDCPRLSGGMIPKDKYIDDSLPTEGFTSVVVSAGSHTEAEVKVDAAGCLVHWEFHTLDNDIAYSLLYAAGEGEPSVLLPLTRVDCHLVPEQGSHVCDKPGRYILRLDNRFSYFRSKTVHFVFAVAADHAADAEVRHGPAAAAGDGAGAGGAAAEKIASV